MGELYKAFNAWCGASMDRLLSQHQSIFALFIAFYLVLLWIVVSALFMVAVVGYGIFCLILWIVGLICKKGKASDDSSEDIIERIAQENRARANETTLNKDFDEYMDGLAYEKYCAARLKLYGFTNIMVTKGSGDFGADIIATDKDGKRVSIQCKKYQGSVGLDAVQEVHTSRSHYGCERAMVITTSNFTPAARQQARECGVELVSNFK